ncbi:MAG: metal-dependent hydrolase [Bacteroidales bacterium]|jgi:inner membrane protein|nr:metal-dependent hydrolase [Bacteroidales bacterium]
MDLLSYMLLGAIVGGFIAARKTGNQALIIGAIIATIPCLDELLSGITLQHSSTYYSGSFFHSILFILIASPLIAWILTKLRPNSPYTLAQRCVLVFWVLAAHIVLDIFTISGVKIFAPFNSWHIAIASIAPFDLFFSFLLLASIIITLIVKQFKIKTMVLWCALFFSTLYLAFSVINKLYIKTEFEQLLQQHELPYSRIGIFPITGSNFKWNCVAQNNDTYWQSYLSNFSNENVEFNVFAQNNHYIADFKTDKRIEHLKCAANNFYTITVSYNALSRARTIIITDLRYVRKNINAQLFFSHSYQINTQNGQIQLISTQNTNH